MKKKNEELIVIQLLNLYGLILSLVIQTLQLHLKELAGDPTSHLKDDDHQELRCVNYERMGL